MTTGGARPSTGSQIVRFAAIGVAGTAVYVGLYLVLRCGFGAQTAGVTARVLLAVPTTWLNGRWSFGRRVAAHRLVLGAVATVAAGAVVTSGVLGLEHAVLPQAGRLPEVGALVAANCLAAGVRFLVLRHGVFAGSGAVVPGAAAAG